ncbi:MAG TPA: glycogen/starch synthase [Candidatus Kapabacteria bacterium]|nr:glycogen/starch synthase [Candidatus Kapabacteria bacterium]
MAKGLNILFVSSELYPFAKESGIGDVAFSLPLALKELGHDVRVIFPKYGVVSEKKFKIHYVNRLRDIPIKILDKYESAAIKSSIITNQKAKVQTYVVSNDYYFDKRKGIYHDPVTWEEYPDNAERFIFFNKAVAETCSMLGWVPNIIHCNDWQSALLPAMLKELYPHQFKKTKTIFTIHNFYKQGVYDLKEFDKTGLSSIFLNDFKFKNKFNFLKGAIKHSNFITTVSKAYAKELMNDKSYSNGLNQVLKERSSIFKGINNGVETSTWNPYRDEYLKYKLKGDMEEFKANNKELLQKEFQLDDDPDIPIFGMVPRIGYQKGTQLLIDAADKIFKNNVRIVLLGEGDNDLKNDLRVVADKYPNQLKLRYEFNEPLSHIIEAGSDFFMMPSQYEPFGLNFLYSMIYGTIPLVRYTGGFVDLSVNIEKNNKKGNAIVFEKYEVDDFVNAIERAVDLYNNKEYYKEIVERNRQHDFSWKKSAKEYVSIYKQILKESVKENEENI